MFSISSMKVLAAFKDLFGCGQKLIPLEPGSRFSDLKVVGIGKTAIVIEIAGSSDNRRFVRHQRGSAIHETMIELSPIQNSGSGR